MCPAGASERGACFSKSVFSYRNLGSVYENVVASELATPDYHIQNALVLDNIRDVGVNGKTTYIPDVPEAVHSSSR